MTSLFFFVLLVPGSLGGVCYRGSSSGSSSSSSSSGGGVPASNRHSVGPIWGPAASRSSYESLKGAPAPPRRSDSYAAIRNHERPNSWSSLEHARSLRWVGAVKSGWILIYQSKVCDNDNDEDDMIQSKAQSLPLFILLARKILAPHYFFLLLIKNVYVVVVKS